MRSALFLTSLASGWASGGLEAGNLPGCMIEAITRGQQVEMESRGVLVWFGEVGLGRKRPELF